MAAIVFNPAKFRVRYPQFADAVKWPDERLEELFETGSCFIWPVRWSGMRAKCQGQALNLMVAHLGTLEAQIMDGTSTAGIQTGATIDRVSVTLQAPPVASGWQHWLSTTPYGLQLWALLSMLSRGGQYVGGWPERAGFRKGGGVF